MENYVWRKDRYLEEDISIELTNVDSLISKGKEESRNKHQINAGTILDYLIFQLMKSEQKYYFVFLMSSDIYYQDYHFVIGLASSCSGTVVSTNRFQELIPKTRFECIKTETMHEVGHVFGLISPVRENIDDSIGKALYKQVHNETRINSSRRLDYNN
ncbi:hypothetical protein ACFL0D_07190 [Thermoproteota archaeon]